MLTPLEVDAGLVIRFDPDRLREVGARPGCPVEVAVRGWHYFVCLGRTGTWSVWTPAFSRWRQGRIRLGVKAGHPGWTDGDSFVDLRQRWIVPDRVLGTASAGVDRSRRGTRNRVSMGFVADAVQAESEAAAAS